MTNLMAAGLTCGAVAVASFGGAVKNTFKLHALRTQWDETIKEGVPKRFQKLLGELE